MKRLIILALCLAYSLMAVAQQENDNPKVKVGVRVGGVGSYYVVPKGVSINLNPSKDYAQQSMKIGATAGLSVDILLTPKLHLQTGLMYSLQRNGEHGFGKDSLLFEPEQKKEYDVDAYIKYRSHHLKLPVMLMYHVSTNPNHFCLGAGVFADFTMGGRLNYSASARPTEGDSYLLEGDFNPYEAGNKYLYYHPTNDSYSQKMLVGNGTYFKRFNLGVSAELGYQISKFYIGAHLDFGVLNMARPEMCGENYKQRPLDVQVLIGYNIN